MRLGPLSFFGLGARIARPFIQLAVRVGRSITRVGSALQRRGVQVEAGALRRIATAEERLRRETRTVLGARTDVVLPPEQIPEAITRQRRRFAWRVRFGIVDRRTGDVTDRFLTLSTDDLLSADEALSEAQGILEADYPDEFQALVDSEIVNVTQAAPGRRL